MSEQLFCFTYAGGNAAFFDPLAPYLPDIQIISPEYAGHGSRHREPFYDSFDALADDMYGKLLEQYSGGDYALFGYSMGTISLVEVIRRILSNDAIPNPVCVFLAAHEPHTKSELAGFGNGDSDAEVMQRTIRFGAVPEKLQKNRIFWRTYLPLYRADYAIIGKYRFEALELKTDIPAVVFYSETDTPRADMELWKRYFSGTVEYYSYPGNHFFIREHDSEIGAVIAETMNRYCSH